MALSCFLMRTKSDVVQVLILDKKNYKAWLEEADEFTKKYLESIKFDAKDGACCPLVDSSGSLIKVLFCPEMQAKWQLGNLAKQLPEGDYELCDPYNLLDLESAYIGYALGCYVFNRYKKVPHHKVRLYLPAEFKFVEKYIRAHYLVRDLVTTPAEDLGPKELAQQAKKLAQTFSAKYTEIVGEDLLKENYPGIHAVGRASHREPRLVDITWGNAEHPKVTLVGKGVCFDSGGLDIKGASGMLIMHKDMGGAAHVLALARLIMDYELPVRLRVLVPCVENLINEHAFKPSDIYVMRDGTSIEIKNTDAEGRVILADPLFEAQSEKPDLIIDFATLTGAMRVALGSDIPGFFTTKNKTASDVQNISEKLNDPVWRMPLYEPYNALIKSNAGEIANASSSGLGGAITAALFLKHFVKDAEWMHVDLMAWNETPRPGQPVGGEAMALRTFFTYLQERYK